MDIAILCFLPLISLIFYLIWRAVDYRSKRTRQNAVNEKGQPKLDEKDPYQDIDPLPDFEWSKTPPIRNSPLKPKYHLTMALENISISDLLAIDDTYVERMSLRRSIMNEHPDATVRCNSACEPAVLEFYDWIFTTYLPRRFPRLYSPTQDGLLNTASNEVIPRKPPSAIEALKTLGGHVDTDFLLLLPSSKAADDSPIYHLEAFVTCFPSGFSTQNKLGLPLAEIHTPVPGYKAKLEKSMDRFFAKVECGRAVKRSNWALTTNSVLFSEGGNHLYQDGSTAFKIGEEPEAGGASTSMEDDIERQKREVVIENCRLRSERQTLFRLPKTKALVFGFKTYQYKLEDVKKEGYAEELAEAMEGLAKGNVPEMDFYKRGVVWREPVVEYLRS